MKQNQDGHGKNYGLYDKIWILSAKPFDENSQIWEIIHADLFNNSFVKMLKGYEVILL